MAAACDCGTPWTFFLPFFQESNYLFICEMWLFDLFFSSIPQSDMSRLEYLEVFQRVPLTSRYIAFHVFIVHLFLFCWFIGKTVYSEYFRESFGVRDNESRLYFKAL